MKNKLVISLISLLSIINPTYAFSIPFKIPQELKAWGIMFGKMTIGVIISILVIWVGLNIYKKILENKLAQPEKTEQPKEKKQIQPKQNKQRNNNNNFKCEIDDTQSIDEAINVFLTIDNQR